MSKFALLGVVGSCAVQAVVGQTYAVTVSNKGPVPSISVRKQPGTGFSPCTYAFNPAWLAPMPGSGTCAVAHLPIQHSTPLDPLSGLNSSILIFRAALCPDAYGGAVDHLLYAPCDINGVCGDVQPLHFPLAAQAEDPRVVWWNGTYWMYIYAQGPGQNTVYLYRTATPLVPSSWELVVGQLPWHRNGCVLLRQDGLHYVIYGESAGPTKGPLPGIGIATTRDFVTYTTLNATWLEPLGANNTQVRMGGVGLRAKRHCT